MSTNQPSWEGTFLAFALIFTVLIGLAYVFANIFRFPVPWLAVLIGSIAISLGLRYARKPRP
jgi:cytochrome c biogenesis protein CcdA